MIITWLNSQGKQVIGNLSYLNIATSNLVNPNCFAIIWAKFYQNPEARP